MPEERHPVHTGGCQCGAVRYALYVDPAEPDICHCRMCQKAFGSFFAPLAGVKLSEIAWTRGSPATFMSSELAERGFCARCGTPLTFRYIDRDRISVSIGSLDAPHRVKPVRQYGTESRVPWLGELESLPGLTTEEDTPPERLQKLRSRQHPDHDTEAWPPPAA
jgi:hypothetical protein